MMMTFDFAKILHTIRTPVYSRFITGNSISLIGSWMQRMAVGWLTWSLTGSTFWLGIIAFADLFPTILVGPIAGTFADRFSRLKIIQYTELLACGQAIVLFILTITGKIDIFWLTFLTLFLGCIMALNQPARLAIIPSLVPNGNLNSAIGLNSVIINLARFIGPAISGLIIAITDIAWVFATNIITFSVFLGILSGITISESSNSSRRERKFLPDLFDGFGYAFKDPVISKYLLLLMVISLGSRPLMDLLPGFAGAVFNGGPMVLAALTSAFGAGAMLGGLWLAGRGDNGKLEDIVTVSAFTTGLMLLIFVATSSLWIAVPTTALIGIATIITGAGVQTIVQLKVLSEMRGRVMALYGLILRGGPAIGALSMGWLAESSGLRWALGIGAALVLISSIVIKYKK